MTFDAFLRDAYGVADLHAAEVLVGAAVLPVLGTLLAWVGKGGKTDKDGRWIASTLVGFALLAVVLELLAVAVARSALGVDVLQANAALLVAPFVCLGLTVIGVRRVFPLSELGSVRTAMDLGLLVVVLLGLAWLFSRFHWGVVFFGTLGQLGLIGVVVGLFVWRLTRRVGKGLAERPA